MKKRVFLIAIIFPLSLYSQVEKYPIYTECIDVKRQFTEKCFYEQTKKIFFREFNSSILKKENSPKAINVTFLTTNSGVFKVIYMNSSQEELKNEVARVFDTFPKVTPAMLNEYAVEMRFVITIPNKKNVRKIKLQRAFKSIAKNKSITSKYKRHSSQLNIPFVYQRYIPYEFSMHKAENTHTAVKPYIYSSVNTYMNLDKEKEQFLKPNLKSRVAKKLWNEHLLEVNGEGYWFNLNFLTDVQLGKDNSKNSFTYNSTFGVNIHGGFGDKFSFSATILEGRGRFSEYISNFIENPSNTFKPAFSAGLVPGRGKTEGLGGSAFYYPVTEGYFSYTPNKFLQFQLGNGKNFIGDGYRSLLLSDVSSPMPFLKLTATFGKLKYSSIWLWGTDVRQPVVMDNTHARKYIALHYLSININRKLNIGLFESAVSKGDEGFDMGFLNPLIFYRTIEFGRGEDAGNTMLGLTVKYKVKKNLLLYSQVVVDEFFFGRFNDLGFWANKFGVQFGAKYFNAFKIKNLFLQGEFNMVRPYTFSHKDPVLNYANYSQPLAHAWGANFWETVGIINYKFKRWTGTAKFTLGEKGFDKEATISYGGDIYKSYEIRRGDENNELAQGNKAAIFLMDLQARYLLNPSSNLSLFGGVIVRKFSPETATAVFKKSNQIWFTIGIKADLFNWYFDF